MCDVLARVKKEGTEKGRQHEFKTIKKKKQCKPPVSTTRRPVALPATVINRDISKASALEC